eukprot:scaffold6955_cov63-Phaeocystis_antarctica.AAC.1
MLWRRSWTFGAPASGEMLVPLVSLLPGEIHDALNDALNVLRLGALSPPPSPPPGPPSLPPPPSPLLPPTSPPPPPPPS